MTADQNAPATKEDVRLLMEEIGKLYDATERWKDEVLDEVKGHFDLVAENIRHDFRGAFDDKLRQHEDQLSRLERHAGFRAA